MKRILHCINASDVKRGGAQRMLVNISDVPDFEHSVFCIEKPNSPRDKVGGRFWPLQFIWTFLRLRPEIVVVHTRKYLPVAWFLRNFSRSKFVFVCHSEFRSYNRLFSIFELDYYVAISNSVRSTLSLHLPARKITTIYNGVDPDSMNPEKLALKDTRDSQRNPIRKIGYVGTFNKTKGLDLLLDVFKQLSSFSEYQYELYLVGDGEMRGDAEAFKSSYSSNVKILGYRENPFEWLDDVDFVVIPSRQEGFCLVLIECLLSKKPVVCSDLAPLKEIAGEYSSVTFFEAGDHSDLLRKIEQWYSSADLLSDSEISDIATSVSLRFSKAKMQSEYHKLFSSL